MTLGNNKAVPRSIAVFGAATRLGKAFARHARYAAPGVRLRLLTTNEKNLDGLRREFPDAECVVANLYDAASLAAPLAGMEGVFVVTPPTFDEKVGMQNLVDVLRKADCAVHVIRITGYEPEAMERRWPENAQGFGLTRHRLAKRILDASDLPVTYLNVGATFIDNFLFQAPLVKESRRFVYVNRLITYIDSRDVGEIAARLLLSTDERNIYQFLTVNNGQDILTIPQVVDILSDVLEAQVTADTSRESFIELLTPKFKKSSSDHEAALEQMITFVEFEQTNSAFLSLNDLAERLLGRKPLSVDGWFREHRQLFGG